MSFFDTFLPEGREDMMKYFKKIVGERVYLSPINSEDCLKYVEWLNDFEIAKYIAQYSKVLTIEKEEEWISKNKDNEYTFGIILKDCDKLIGNISLVNIKDIDKTAELGIFIGDKDYLSKGYGSEAIMLLLDYGFNYLNLNNIMLRALAFNERAIKAYQKCGFKIFGTWKEAIYFNGEYIDEVYMNILKKNFYNK